MYKTLKLPLFILILTFVAYSFVQFPGFQGYEDETYHRIITNLEAGEFKTARSGYAQVLLETPFVWKGKILENILNVQHGKISQLFALFYNPFVTAVEALVMFLIFNLFTNKRKSLFYSLLFAFGTMVFPYASIGMDPTAVLFVVLSVYFLFRFGKYKNNRDLTLSGLFYFLLLFSKAYYFITLPAYLGYLALTFNPTIFPLEKTAIKNLIKSCLLFFSPLILVLPLYLISNKYNFGVYFGGQYKLSNELLGGENPIFGIYGLLLSFGKSLFIYNPVLILSLILIPTFYRKYKKEGVFTILFSILMILFVASIHWWSDETWGPRYLLSFSAIGLLPIIMLPEILTSKVKRTFCILLITFSFTFQLLGSLTRYDVFPYSFYEIYGATKHNVLASQEYQYIPQFAPYLVNYQLLKNKILGQEKPLSYSIKYSPPMEMAATERGESVIKEITYDNNKYQAHVSNFWWMNVPGISPYQLFGVYLLVFVGLFWWGKKLLEKSQISKSKTK